MTRLKRKTVSIVVLSAALGITGLVSTGYADFSLTNKMSTKEQVKEVQESVQSVITPYGEFIRTDKEISFGKKETAQSKDEVNENTKALILNYGVFVKE